MRYNRVMDAARKAGMTVKELSTATGITVNALNNYKYQPEHLPNIQNARRIAKATGVTVNYLMGWDV